MEVDDTVSQVGESLAREACRGFPLALYIFAIFYIIKFSSTNSSPIRADNNYQNRSKYIESSIYLPYSVPSYGPFNVEVIRQESETMSYKITGTGTTVTDTFQARTCDVAYAQIYYEATISHSVFVYSPCM